MVMLEDFRLKVFLTVAAEKSFTKAADILGVSQPVASQNVAELEKGLGVRLFQRLRGETVLTPEGEVFLKHAEHILSYMSDTQLLFSELDVKTVRISASDEVYYGVVLPALKDFVTIHPEVVIEQSSAEAADIMVSAAPAHVSGKSPYFEMVYKPTQAFAFTKTCMVIKNQLDF
jgi:DNA-binding transcriptional LysR family regulator